MKRIIGVAAFVAAIGLAASSAPTAAQTGSGALWIDTVVNGPAAPGDFSFTVGGMGPIVDTDSTECILTAGGVSGGCSNTVFLTAGEPYSLVESSIPASYVQTGLSCQITTGGVPEGTGSSIEIGVEGYTLCTVTYTYVTQEIGVDVVVINDDGGTATAADVTVRLLDSGGNVLQTGMDPEEGTGPGNAMLIFTVPLGDYTVEAVGPADYTIEVATTIIERPVDRASSSFSVTSAQTANLVVTINDPAATTTTTTAPPANPDPPTDTDPPASTTATPTTAAPAVLPASSDLPVTGATDETLPITLVALLFLGLGGGALVAARRD